MSFASRFGAVVCAGFCCLAVFSHAQARAQNVAPTEPLSAAEQLKKFRLPPGFEIHLVACEPAIHKPINLSFDARGRLWVSESVEYPFPAPEGRKGRDAVKTLLDRDGDGAADEVVTFADGLNIPLGVGPIPGGALIYAIPNIERCIDADGDGRADQRKPVYAAFGFKDTHGMANSFTRGLDGWMYACHGFSNNSTVAGGDGQPITMTSGNTFRMRVDGSHVEYFTHGQVNPFGLAFDPLGNLYSADCHTLPVYSLLRGAYYPSFGKAHDGLDFGPTMMSHSHGSSGIGGVAYYAAEQFPDVFRDNIFVGNVVTGKVNRDRLEKHGSTLLAKEMPDLVTCDDPWFRPVNLQVGPDGALYIADFYNRIIGHYEVPLDHPGRDRERGRIWRLVYTGKGKPDAPAAPPAKAPDIAGATVPALLELLGHANLTVRTLATHEIVDRVDSSTAPAVAQLLKSDRCSANQRAHALWVLERLAGLNAELVERLAKDADAIVRVHLYKALAERAKWADLESQLARAALTDSDPFVRRAAADALGRHPHVDNIRPLLALWTQSPADDTHLIHVARMALRDQLTAADTLAKVPALLGDDTEAIRHLANVSLGVPGERSAQFVWDQISAGKIPTGANLHHVVRYLVAAQLPTVYEFILKQPTSGGGDQGAADRKTIVRALRRATQERGEKLPEQVNNWTIGVARGLLRADAEAQVRAGIDLARETNLTGVLDDVQKAASAEAKFSGLRTLALEACTAIDVRATSDLYTAMLNNPAEPVELRQRAVIGLGRINTDATRATLATALLTAPQRLCVEIAGAMAETQPGAEMLLTAIAAGKASPQLLQETAVDRKLRVRGVADLEERIAKLTAGLIPRDQRLAQLIDARRKQFAQGKPSTDLGQAVFKKNCANCHRIGEEGAKVGPNLDGIGIRGLERVLEDVLDPNRNVDQAFRVTQIVTRDGRVLAGLVLREEGQVIVLADAQGKEVRLPSEEIDERNVGTLSLMPGNVAEQLPPEEFANLLAYLLAQKQAPPAPGGK